MTVRIYERTSIDRFAFPSIGTDSTGGGPLELMSGVTGDNVHSGILRSLAVSCDSTDFSVSIRTCSNGQADTVDEIYRSTNISKLSREDGMAIGWVNNDATLTKKLYLVLVNSDVVRPTGTISLLMMNDINKRFSKFS